MRHVPLNSPSPNCLRPLWNPSGIASLFPIGGTAPSSCDHHHHCSRISENILFPQRAHMVWSYDCVCLFSCFLHYKIGFKYHGIHNAAAAPAAAIADHDGNGQTRIGFIDYFITYPRELTSHFYQFHLLAWRSIARGCPAKNSPSLGHGNRTDPVLFEVTVMAIKGKLY